MVVFPATSGAGMKEVYRKIRKQGKAMLKGLMEAAKHAGGNAEKKVQVCLYPAPHIRVAKLQGNV